MVKRVLCPECGSECQYDDRSVWEGNREMEDFECPVCGHILARVFTDQIPNVILIRRGPVSGKGIWSNPTSSTRMKSF